MKKHSNPQPGQPAASTGNNPTHVAKIRRGEKGEKGTFERIGAGWVNDDGSLYIRLHGTQIVAEGFTVYPIDDRG